MGEDVTPQLLLDSFADDFVVEDFNIEILPFWQLLHPLSVRPAKQLTIDPDFISIVDDDRNTHTQQLAITPFSLDLINNLLRNLVPVYRNRKPWPIIAEIACWREKSLLTISKFNSIYVPKRRWINIEQLGL